MQRFLPHNIAVSKIEFERLFAQSDEVLLPTLVAGVSQTELQLISRACGAFRRGVRTTFGYLGGHAAILRIAARICRCNPPSRRKGDHF